MLLNRLIRRQRGVAFLQPAQVRLPLGGAVVFSRQEHHASIRRDGFDARDAGTENDCLIVHDQSSAEAAQKPYAQLFVVANQIVLMAYSLAREPATDVLVSV